ncbi:AIR synthase related protein [Amycolatopsis sp. NPDC049159]|uniref:thiamine-phosphate kinase n=1 Tax=Amycolatopsis sp. NPDC049159 TaxID=3157210 RepID=UPI0033FFCE76
MTRRLAESGGRRELLTDVGEYHVHEMIENLVNVPGGRVVGDDCAVYELDGRESLLLNVDRLPLNVETYNRARLCVAQTLSDIFCMGGRPCSFMVALTLPRSTTLAAVETLMADLTAELARYDVRLVGGDTKEGPAFHMVGFAWGRAASGRLVRRTGARPGMVVGVTSAKAKDWGLRWANAVIRELGLSVPAATRELCRSADEVIELPESESRAAIDTGRVRAGLDLSDGVGGGIRILARVSAVKLALDRAALATLPDRRLQPVAEALELPLEAFALSPGYDWENMYVVDADGVEEVVDAVASAGGRFTVIGRVDEGSGVELDGLAIDENRLPVDEKFARDYVWEQRFSAWRDDCRAVLGNG